MNYFKKIKNKNINTSNVWARVAKLVWPFKKGHVSGLSLQAWL